MSQGGATPPMAKPVRDDQTSRPHRRLAFDAHHPVERERLVAHVILETALNAFEWDLVAHVLSGHPIQSIAEASGVSPQHLLIALEGIAWRASFVLHPRLSPFSCLGVRFPRVKEASEFLVKGPDGKHIGSALKQRSKPGHKVSDLARIVEDRVFDLSDEYRDLCALWAHRLMSGAYLRTHHLVPALDEHLRNSRADDADLKRPVRIYIRTKSAGKWVR